MRAELSDKLREAERIFLDRDGYEGITKSIDSSEKKMIFAVPIRL